MNKENLKKLLVQTVINKGGCKDIDLVKNQEVALFLKNLSDLPKLIDELVDEGNLKKVEYILETLGNFNSRIRYFLLPSNAAVKIGTIE